MPFPLLPSGSLRTQRGVSEAELTDVVTLHRTVKTKLPTNEYSTAVVDSDPVLGLLLPMGAAAAERAAAQGVAAKWSLFLPNGTVAKPGWTATVERQGDDEQWTRDVSLTSVEVSGGVHLTCTAVDVALNQ